MDYSNLSSETKLALERRAPFQQRVYDVYEIRDGAVGVTDWSVVEEKRRYFPMTASPMLYAFYKVVPGDEGSALQFVSNWGSLGFQEMRREASDPFTMEPDPLPWIWLHANGVRIAMDLIRLTDEGDRSKIVSYLDRLRMSDSQILAESEVSHTLHLWRHEGRFPDDQAAFVGEAREIFRREDGAPPGDLSSRLPEFAWGLRDLSVRSAISNPDAHELALDIIGSIISPNLKGVFPQLAFASPLLDGDDGRGLTLVQGADSLMSVIYRHLADMVLGGAVLTCLECGTPFVRRAGRGRYCPPPPWSVSRSSSCYERAKKRKHRARTGAKN